MRIFVRHNEGEFAPQFIDLCMHLKCENDVTREQLTKNGFEKHQDDLFIYQKYLNQKNNIRFSISVEINEGKNGKENFHVGTMSIWNKDEFKANVCHKEYYEQIKTKTDDLIKLHILKTYDTKKTPYPMNDDLIYV